jgi:transglutaminase-like putative cysteine protease
MKAGVAAAPGRKIGETLAQLPLMLLMCWSMVYPFVSALGLGLSAMQVLLILLVCLCVWSVALYNKITTLCFVALAAAVSIFVVLRLQYGGEAADTLRDGLDAFFSWAAMYLKGYRSTNVLYASRLVEIFGAFVTLAVFLFTVKQFDLMTVALSGAACYVALVVIGHEINLPALFAFILALSLYIALHGYKKNAREMSEGKCPALHSYMAAALPLAAVVLAGTVLLSGSLRVDPGWMKDFRDRLLNKNEVVVHPLRTAAVKQAISGEELGGNVYLTDSVVMKVESPVGNVHLRAQSKEYYTGHSWVKKDTAQVDYQDTLPGDTQETQAALAGNSALFDRLFPAIDIYVTYTGLDTGVVHVPLKMCDISAGTDINVVGGDMYMLAGRSDSNLGYGVRFLQPAYGDEDFIALARDPLGGAHSDIQAAGRTADIRDTYTQLPGTLPRRVRDLAAEITQGETSDYDKAKAVEGYLRSNYAYTTTPGGWDKSGDFVDQFLFEGKKGYCTYFASAMAVLLRCEGVPARYVEGYVLPGSTDAEGIYEVTEKQGHAWVEAYIDGLGWLTFEPTSSFSNVPAGNAGPTVSPSPSSSPSPTPDASASPKPTHTAGQTVEPDEEAAGKRASFPVLPLLIVLAAAAAAFVLFAIPYRARLGMLRLGPNDAAVRLFGHCLRLLALQGMALGRGEGLVKFAAKVDRQSSLPRPGFRGATETFLLARFSGQGIGEERKQKMLAFRKELLDASRKKLGIFRYLFFKYIWGI